MLKADKEIVPKSIEVEFNCLKNFAPLEEYLSELEKKEEIEGGSKEPVSEKSEWYKYAEEIINSEKTKKKPLPDVTFEDLLAYWMKEGI